MRRFDPEIPALYHPETPAPGGAIVLSDEEGQHCRALRLREGDRVVLLDGKGSRTEGRIERMERSKAVVRAESIVFDEAKGGAYIALAIGILSDKSRFEWLLEKAVELGAAELIPLESARAEGHFHRSRAERIARAALKQSQRSWLPKLREPLPLSPLLAEGFDRIYLCHESASSDRLLALAICRHPPAGRILLLVGPEGGFTEEEVRGCEDGGGEVVSLGEARLRAETAAIAALSILGAR